MNRARESLRLSVGVAHQLFAMYEALLSVEGAEEVSEPFHYKPEWKPECEPRFHLLKSLSNMSHGICSQNKGLK